MFKNLRRKMHRNLMFAGVVIIIAGFIASGIISSFEEKAMPTYAIITEIADDGSFLKDNTVSIRYSVNGTFYDGELGYCEDDMVKGQTVNILYDPEKPEKIRPAEGPDTAKRIYILGGAVFLAGLGLNIFMSLNERRRADKRAEKRMEKKYRSK